MRVKGEAVAVPDLTGERFGLLVVTQHLGRRQYGKLLQHFWLVECDCGVTKALPRSALRYTRSCGCQRGGKGHKKNTFRYRPIPGEKK